MRNFFTYLKLCCFFLLFLNFNVDAQLGIAWEKTIGGNDEDHLSQVIETPDGNYLLAGTSSSGVSHEKTAAPRGGNDYWILEVDPEGNIIWDKAYGGSGEDELHAVLNTPDGGFLLAGSSTSGASGEKSSPSQGGADYWLVKTDASGAVLWEKAYGGSADDILQSVLPASWGGYLLAGYSTSGASGDKSDPSRGDADFWVVAVDAAGNMLWDKTYGGEEEEWLWAATPAQDGGFLLGGTSMSGVSGEKTEPSRGDQDFWVVRIDAAGNMLWDRTLGGEGYEGLRTVEATANGDFLVGGFSHSNASGDKSENRLSEEYYSADFWLVRLDAQGNKLWDKTLGGEGYDALTAIVPVPEGGYLLGGESTSGSSVYKSENSQGSYDYWMVRVDESGNKLWDKAVGGSGTDYRLDMIATSDGGYLLGGSGSGYASGDKSSDTRGGFYDFWVVKMEEIEEGNPPVIARPQVMIEWDKAYVPVPGTLGEGELVDVAATPDGGYALGVTTPYRSGRWTDYGIIKLDAAGNRLWDKAYGGTEREELRSVLALPDGGYLLAGFSFSNASLDKSEDKRVEGYSPDYWAIRIDAEGNKLWDRTFGSAGDDYFQEAVATADGGFLLGGDSYSWGASGDKSEDKSGFWVVKMDASGNKLWDRTFGDGSSVTFETATEAADGNGFLLGGSIYNGPDTRGGSDYWVVRVDRDGNKMWDRTFGGHTAESVRALAPVPDGGFIIGGWSPSRSSGDKSEDNRGYSDFWVLRVDASGNLLWEKTYGGNSSEYLWDIVATKDGGYVLAGESYSDISYEKSEDSRGHNDYWALKIDAEGNKLWDKTAGGNSYEDFVGAVETQDGGILLVGNSRSGISGDKTEDAESDTDYWLVKIKESAGGLLSGGGWFYSPAGAFLADPFVEGRAIFSLAIQSKENNALKGRVNFTFPEANLRFSSSELDWLVITAEKAVLTGSGQLNRQEGYRFLISVEDRTQRSPSTKDTYRIVIWDPVGRMVYDNQRGEALYAPANFEINAGNIHVQALQPKAVASNRKLQQKFPTKAITLPEGFNVYPVPLSQEGLWLDFPAGGKAQKLKVSILDMQGRTMAEKTIPVGRTAEKHLWKLDHQQWSPGLYLLRIDGGQLLYQQKLLK